MVFHDLIFAEVLELNGNARNSIGSVLKRLVPVSVISTFEMDAVDS